MDLLLNCLMIFFVRIVDVSLGTLGTVLIIRNKRFLGSVIGFVNVAIWFLVVRQALSIENASLWITVAYAGGFATGTYVGSWVESKLAFGSSSVTVITRGVRDDVVDVVRKTGYAVSVVKCHGKEGENLMLIIEVGRKKVNDVIKVVNTIVPDSFISVSDTTKIINGYFR
jgi:uncharacterized protein YebE (UPF0316 family)